MSARVCVGQIGAPHGVRGLVVVRSFTEVPEDVTAYGPVTTESGAVLVLELRSSKKTGLIAAIEGVEHRDAAEALKGELLYVARDRLPEPDEDEYYHTDLIGLEAVDTVGLPLGRVVAVHDFGAGDLIEIGPDQGEPVLVPFTRETVPVVDIAGGRIVLEPSAWRAAEAAGETAE